MPLPSPPPRQGAPMPDTQRATDHRRGTTLAAVGVTVLSFDALLVRLADTTPANVLFWRGLFIAVSVAVALRLVRGRWPWTAVSRAGRPAWVLVVTMALLQILFVTALMHTSVANVVIILTAAPLFAAVFSGLFLGEWVPPRTWLAMLLCIGGIALVFGGSFGTGNWLGDSLALAAAIVVAANLTMLRRSPGISRLALISGGGLLACAAAAVPADPLGVTTAALAVLALMGLLQMPVALVMMTEATRYLPSAEVSLFLVIEAILGTYWVWLILGEEPPGATLAGGALVIATLVAHSWAGMRRAG